MTKQIINSMKPKRVLIASFVLIFVGLFFMLNFEGNITGAVAGAPTTALNSTSNILFGFFLIWIAGIMLIGTVDEKVTTEVLKKREKQIREFAADHDYAATKAYIKAIESTGKKPRELKEKERLKVVEEIYEAKKDDYLSFLDLKGKGNYWGQESLETMYYQTSGTTPEDLGELAENLTSEGLAKSTKKSTVNLIERLRGYMFGIKEKDIEALGKEFSKKLGISPDKVKTRENVIKLYNLLTGQEVLESQKKKYKK